MNKKRQVEHLFFEFSCHCHCKLLTLILLFIQSWSALTEFLTALWGPKHLPGFPVSKYSFSLNKE